MDAALDFQEMLFEAQSQGGSTRREHLRQAHAALNKLRLNLRLAHRWHWLNDGQYQHVSTMVAELGRLLGGWMKAWTRGVSRAGSRGDASLLCRPDGCVEQSPCGQDSPAPSL